MLFSAHLTAGIFTLGLLSGSLFLAIGRQRGAHTHTKETHVAIKIAEFDSAQNIVTLESDLGDNDKGFEAAVTELTHPDARRAAVKHATEQGCSRASCGLVRSPYPIDKDGNRLGAGMNPAEFVVHRFRLDVPIQTGNA